MKRTSKGILLVALVVLMTLLLFACNGIKIGINFVVDGESYYQIKTNGEEEITMPDPPDKEGYVFKGWFFDENVWQEQLTIYSLINRPLDSVIDVYAYFITQEEADRLRTVNFNSMGAGEIESVETKVGMLIEEPSVSKSGYLFSGWFTSPDFATKWDFAKNTVSSDMTLYAKWVEDIPENRLYTVSFNTNGGSSVDNVSDIVYNTTITKPTNPTRSGYALVGWYTDNTFAKEWNFAQDTVKTSFTLYAKWERADVAACELVSAEGFAIDADTLYIKTPNAQAVFNFLDKIEVSAFASWTVVNDLQGKDVVPSGNVELNVGDNTKYILVTSYDGLHKKFYTVTIRRRPTYSVTLIHNNGTEDTVNATYEEDASIDFPELELEGYTLAGWTYEEDEEEEVWADTDTVQGNITLNAKWTANEYTVTFNSDGGNDIESKSVVFDDEYTFPVPEKRGYTFKGWSYHDELITDDEGACVTIWNTAKDVTVKAVWEETVYTITYENARGAVNNNAVSYTITQNVTFNTLSKDGYVFRKWLDEEETEITGIEVGSIGNRTITAEWTLVGYAATFFADGAEVETLDFNVETTSLVEPAIPEKTGYTSAWETYSFPAHDITVNAIYTPIVYTISYVNVVGQYDVDTPVNNNVATYTIESPTIALSNASKTAYTFDGWTENDEQITQILTGSIGNRIIVANWTAIEYSIEYTGLTGDYDIDAPVNENVTTYTVESAKIDLTNASKTGYTFNGWTANGAAITQIPAKSYGNKTLSANWTPITYIISYTNIAGQYDVDTPVNNNVTTYTIESPTIALSSASKTAYTFNGWTENDEAITKIPSKSYGNKVITANWTPIDYTLTFVWNDEIGGYKDGESNPATYTVEDTITFNVLENKAVGYISLGWFTSKNEGTGDLVAGILLRTTGNKVFYAHWGLEEYDIVYHNVSGVTNTNATTYTVETEDFVITDVSKVGYDFGGWYADSSFEHSATTTIAKGSYGDLNLYAKWVPIAYSLTFVLNGGHYESVENPTSYTIEDQISLLPLVRDGYYFDSWFTLSEGGDRVSSIEKGSVGNKTYYAHWKRVISFETNGGSAVAPIIEAEGKTISAPVAPTKDYYDFVGWYKDNALTEAYSFTVMPAENLILYAKWTPTVYNIIYHLNDGENDEENPATYTVEDGDIALLAASKVGHSFIAWFASEEYNEVVTEIASGSHGTKHLYAKYSVNQYTISFESNGGTSVTEITQNYGTEVTAPASPAKNGYSFAGWFSDSGLKNAYTFTTIAAEDITLYAKWSLVTYTITYQLDGGTNNKANPATFTITSSEIVFSDPTKAGYNFIGWYGDNGFTVSVPGIVSGSYGDKEVFAKWQTIVYDVTYIVPENTINSNIDTFTVETAVTTLSDATKTGYTFNGWFADAGYNSPVVSIAGGAIGNVTVYGKFTSNTYNIWLDGEETASYNVSFNLNGASGSVAGQTVTEENTLVYPTKPTRDGYIFGGWYDNSECTGALYDFTAQVKKNTVLYAKWVSVGTATPIEIGSTANAAIVGQNDLEFIFLPLVSGNVTITASGSIDTYGRLYNEAGVLIAQDDDNAADGLNFLIVYNVTAGKAYTVKVRGFGSAINGNITLSLTGNNVVEAGGYVVTATKSQATYDAAFSLPVPEARDGYKFLGYADGNDTMKTDKTGASLAPWDIADDTVLYSVWERTVYTVTLNANGGTLATNSFTLAFGERMDLNEYVPTLEGKTFKGWYRSVSDTIAYEATTMPDQNISLIAKWTQFDLGEIKYNADKNAVSVSDEITAALFDAICLDTNGEMATFGITLLKGYTVINSIVAGDVIRISIDATSGDVSVNTVIENVKVYGAPTLTLSNGDVGYIRLQDGLKASWFGATGTDTFGDTPVFSVRIDGEYEAGDIVTVYVDATDVAGNVTTETIENVKLYGLPTITYNTNKTAISVEDDLDAALFTATAEDSFGVALDVSVTRVSGTIAAGNTVTLRLSATDAKNDVKTVDVVVKVYGAPTISDAEKTDFKVEDEITVATLGLTAKDTYNVALEIALSVKNGTQTAGNTMVYTASVTDVAGNTTTKDVTVKIYGTPTVSYNKSSLKVTENPIGDPDILNATATDSFGASLAVTVSLLSGNLSEGGTYVTYRLTATDHLGNVGTLNTDPISVYDVADIELVLSAYDDIVKLNSHGEEFDPSATDSFGNSCTFSLEAASGYSIAAGNTVTLYVVATDPAGNKVYSEALPEIKIYGIPTVTYAHEYPYITASEIDSLRYMFTVKDSFNKGLTPKTNVTSEDDDSIVVTVTATDAAKNTVSVEYTLLKIGNGKSYFALYDGDTFIGHQLVTIGSAYDLPVERTGYTFVSWKENGTGSALTDNAGHSLAVWSGEETAYKLVRETTIIVYTVTYNLNGGTNGINPSTFTIVSAEGGIALNDPRKNVSETNVGEYLGNGNYRVTMEATGYTFLGWFTESTFENEVTEITYTGSDVVLYAKWSETTTTQTTTGTQQLFTRENDYIYYGTYPQTQVTDSATKSALTSMAGTLPTSSNSQAWTSYGYYINGSVSNFMWHIDLEYNGEKYRGVYFTSYRPYYTTTSSSTGNSNQDDNGYYTSTVYWFKYEPIKWRILSEANGEALILCEMIIDSQEYCHYTSTSQFSHNGGTGYPNNYALSNIRKWLNDTFYNTAFNDLQKAIIQLTTVDNSARSTNPNNNATAFNSGANTYACANTEDYVFLLSEQEVTNSAYGFNADYSKYDTVRRKKNTDYAKCQGVWTSTDSTYAGNGYWWLRSPYYYYSYGARNVHGNGRAYGSDDVDRTESGVVPALKIRLS